MPIFAGVPSEGGIKRHWNSWKCRFSVLSDAIVFGTLEKKGNVITVLLSSSSPLYWSQTTWPYTLNSVFAQIRLEVCLLGFRKHCVKLMKVQILHILSVAKVFSMDISFCRTAWMFWLAVLWQSGVLHANTSTARRPERNRGVEW